MPNLEIYYDKKIVESIPITTVAKAIEYAKKNSEPNDQKTFIYSTVNPEKMIENTMIIKRPHYG